MRFQPLLQTYSLMGPMDFRSHGCDNLRRFRMAQECGPRQMTLTDQQQIAIIHATRPLQGQERTAFLASLETLLADRTEIGDGELSRLLSAICRGSTSSPPLRPRA